MTNRLAAETSPYLRQHADNPVDWWPWCDEAFERARAEDKPVLLSVGYSSCHWCHVMAHESFEDAETAALVNELVIAVKVDREERPDIDAIYMEAVQAMTGRGGWPMTVFLLPDGRPFFGGTYFPKVRRGNMLSFTELLSAIDDVWRTRRDDLVEQATELTDALRRRASITADDELPGPEVLAAAIAGLCEAADPEWGGFGSAPKFPQAMSLEALLRSHTRDGDPATLAVVRRSLDAMAAGGIHDHLGGGFARYSVDGEWTVPHFEKMLYDQALLARVYLHAWQVTGDPAYRQVLDDTVTYLLRDLRQPEGGFSSAEDADSEGVEGRFYVWSVEEIRSVLGDALAEQAIAWWGVTEHGNFEGRTILRRPLDAELVRPPALDEARALLLGHRATRVRPALDDKVLTEWNALTLVMLAEAAAATGTTSWRDAAVETAEFLVTHLRRDDGRWLRSWQRDGGARHLAYAHDHAALVDAFTRVAELTGEARWIAEARRTADALVVLFWDDERGGVFTTGSDADGLVTRPKDFLDDATPSANSLTAVALLRLAALSGDDDDRARADDVLRLYGRMAERHATAFGHLLAAVDLSVHGTTEIAIVGDRPDLVGAVHQRYLPGAVLAWGEPYDSPLWDGRADGRAYVCRDFACRAPAHDVETLVAQLDS